MKKMLLFTCTNHDGFLTGVTSIIVARSKTEAHKLLNAALISKGLNPNAVPFYTLKLVEQEKAGVTILCNGDY